MKRNNVRLWLMFSLLVSTLWVCYFAATTERRGIESRVVLCHLEMDVIYNFLFPDEMSIRYLVKAEIASNVLDRIQRAGIGKDTCLRPYGDIGVLDPWGQPYHFRRCDGMADKNHSVIMWSSGKNEINEHCGGDDVVMLW